LGGRLTLGEDCFDLLQPVGDVFVVVEAVAMVE
jgi:hypothetical protein